MQGRLARVCLLRLACVRVLSLLALVAALLVACGSSAAPDQQPTTAESVTPSASELLAASTAPSSTPTAEIVPPSATPAETSIAPPPAPAETMTAADQSSGQIAYVKQSQIWLLDLATGASRQLTTEGENSGPAWSPDGQTLAFMRMYDGNAEIATMPVDGSEVTRITHNPANDLHPTYSRNGTLFYARHGQRDKTDMEIIKRDSTGSEAVVYTQPGGLCTPVRLSVAEEHQVALSINCGRGSHAFVIDPATNTVTDISLEYVPTACVYQATWARTQPRLALITAQDCSPQINTGIATLDFGSGPPVLAEVLTNREIWAIDWSPSDQALVFQKESRADPDLSGLWLLPLSDDQREPRQLTREGTSPAWRP